MGNYVEVVFDEIIKLNRELSLIEVSGHDSYRFVKEVKAEELHDILINMNADFLLELIKELKNEFTIYDIKFNYFSYIKNFNNSFLEKKLNELINRGNIKIVGQTQENNNIYRIINNS